MKRIFLLNFGSLGDIHPFIGMGLILKNAGFEVLIGTNRCHVARVNEAGLEAVGIGEDLRPDDPELIRVVMDPRRGPEKLHRDYIFPGADLAIEETLPHAAKSDLLLTGILGYFVPTVSELSKVPWGMCMLAPVGYWSAYDPPELASVPFLRSLRFLSPPLLRFVYKALLSMGEKWAEPLQEARKRRGLRPQPNPLLASTMTGGTLNLALFSKYFAPPQPDWPKNLYQPGYVSYDGPGAHARLNPEIEKFLGAGEEAVLMTLGSTTVMQPEQMYHVFYDAIKPSGQRALLLVGAHNLKDYRKQFGSEQVGVFDYAPYAELMPHCSVIVHQGGAGTTGQCLRAGKPSVIIASANDQPDNARHVEEIGAGVKLPLRKLSVDNLSRALTRAATFRVRTEEIGSLVRSENTSEILIKAVESVIGRSAAVLVK